MPQPATKLLLRNSLCPGDILMLTAAVRDLHYHYPGRFLTDVRTPYPELWEHNPFLTPLDEADAEVLDLECHYPLVNHSNQTPSHCLHGFTEFLNEQLDLNLRPTAFKGDVHVSALERSWDSQVQELTGVAIPFWIIVAGGKRDYTIKWWDPRRYQQVVDFFRGRILFVQVGQTGDHHPPLEGVIDLRGQTDLRQLVRLVYHSQGVVCPVTFLMHLAAAVETPPGRPPGRPCVVVAGGREPPHWEAYPHHQFIHTVGTLPCCADAACWRSRTLPLGDGDPKDRPDELCSDVVNQLPRCMDLITANTVIDRVRLYFHGDGAHYLTPAEAAVAESTLHRLVPHEHRLRARSADPQPRRGEAGSMVTGHRRQAEVDPDRPSPRSAGPASGVLNRSGTAGTTVRRLRRRRPPVTLCVLTYGNYPQLARRCVESILRYGDRRRYELVVGGNAVSPRTLRYLIGLQENGVIDRLHLSPHNLFKNPMMRRMFSAIDTEFIWWFDDDSYMVEPGALDRWLRTARRSASAVAAWGQVYFYRDHTEFSLGSDVREFVRTAPWFRGKELPSARVKPGDRSSRDAPSASDGRWFFPTGGCWLARTAAIRALDWPDRRLLLPADDVFFGEAIRQQGWRVCDVGSLGVAINQSPTRWREKRRLMRRQMAAMNRGAG